VGRELLGSQDQGAVFAPNVPGIPDDHDSIWRAVDRIRNSSTMSGCNRLVQLLRFVVGSTLKGEAIYLKETTIGVAVFGILLSAAGRYFRSTGYSRSSHRSERSREPRDGGQRHLREADSPRVQARPPTVRM
jgi:hypothetical protein